MEALFDKEIGQKPGLEKNQEKKVRKILGKLQKHPSGRFFLKPVDEQRDGAPDYYKHIT